MQNSKLSTQIYSKVRADWELFIGKVREELSNMNKTNGQDTSRYKELDRIVPRIEEIKKKAKSNVSEILNKHNIDFLLYIDNSLKENFECLKFFSEQGNLDNDAVMDLFNRIVNSPKIKSSTDEYNELKNKTLRKHKLEDLINENSYNQELVIELLDKFELDDNIRKNVLFYSVVMNSNMKDKNSIKNEDDYQKFEKLYQNYLEDQEEDKGFLGKCYHIKNRITSSEYDTYKGYINNPSEINYYGFDNDELLKIYVLALFKLQKDIDNFIKGTSDLQVEEIDFVSEYAFFKDLLDEYEKTKDKIFVLLQNSYIDAEDSVFFALNKFNGLLIDKDILIQNRDSIGSFVNNYNAKFSDVNVIQMQGVEKVEELLGKPVYMVIGPDYRLAYIVVNNCVLVLTGVFGSDRKFNRLLKDTVETYLIPIKKQMDMINEMNPDYINLQNDIISSIFTRRNRK